jgi:hypothetical protein
MNEIVITSLATDTYFNFVRLGVTVKTSEWNEDFVYFKKFDPTTRDMPVVELESWVNSCKRESVHLVNRVLASAEEDVECCEDCTPPAQPTVAPVTAPAVEAPKPEPKKRAAKVAPVVAAPVTAPAVEAPAAPVAPAPVVETPSTPAGDSIVNYDKLNKDHARWLQSKLDAIDSGWKADAKKVDFAKNKLVPSMHCTQPIFMNDVECAATVAALSQVFIKQDTSLWPTV